MNTNINLNRRDALKTIASSTLVCATGILGADELVKSAYAMGKADTPQGMQKVEGDVKINGTPAKLGDIVSHDDIITTGKNSSAIFVINDSAYMMRENSKLIVKNSDKDGESKKGVINVLRLLDGKLLSVFGSGDKTVETPSAYIGIRGTGIYIEVDHEKTYICTCYGKVLISSASDIENQESITAKYHEFPRYVYRTSLIKPAPILNNHKDSELVMLGALVGRFPPFAKKVEKQEERGGY
ncbi:MAG: FecR domain-containing protein [Desulfamplus sp.]|nr:FecR domain-containing protein [Desulfamplus sp.]